MIHNGRINSLDISNDPLQISWGESSIQVVDPKFEIISSGQSFRLEFVRIVPNVVRQVFVGFLMWEWDVEPRDDKYRLAGHLYEEAEPGAIAGEPGSWYATLDRADCLDADLQ